MMNIMRLERKIVHRREKLRIFDWDKAARLIVEYRPKQAVIGNKGAKDEDFITIFDDFDTPYNPLPGEWPPVGGIDSVPVIKLIDCEKSEDVEIPCCKIDPSHNWEDIIYYHKDRENIHDWPQSGLDILHNDEAFQDYVTELFK